MRKQRDKHERHAEIMEREIIAKARDDGSEVVTICRSKNQIIVKFSPGVGKQFEPLLVKFEHEILKKGCRWWITEIKDNLGF